MTSHEQQGETRNVTAFTMNDILTGRGNENPIVRSFSNIFDEQTTSKIGEGLMRMKKFMIIEVDNILGYDDDQLLALVEDTVIISVRTIILGSLPSKVRALYLMEVFKEFVSQICHRIPFHFPKFSVVTTGLTFRGSELSGSDMARPSISRLLVEGEHSLKLIINVIGSQDFWVNSSLVRGVYLIEIARGCSFTIDNMLCIIRDQIGPASSNPFNIMRLLDVLLRT